MKYIFIIIFFLLFVNIVSASVEYGDGWKKDCQDNGKCSYQNYYTIQKWNGKYIPYSWLNIDNGNWTYNLSQNTTHYNLSKFDEFLVLPKNFANYTFSLTDVSMEFTVTPSQLNSKSTANGSGQWYITIPDKATKTRFIWDNKKPIVSNNTGNILDEDTYWYSVVNNERRLNYNQTARNFGIASQTVTFQFNSWTVGSEGNAWTGNSSWENVTNNTEYIVIGTMADYFTSNNTAQWNVVSGTWNADSGFLNDTGIGRLRMNMSGITNITAFDFSFSWRNSSVTNNDNTIKFFIQDNAYTVSDWNHNFVGVYISSTAYFRLMKGATWNTIINNDANLSQILDGNWHTIRISFDGNNLWKMWVDNVLHGQGTQALTYNSNGIQLSFMNTFRNLDNIRYWNTTSGNLTTWHDSGTGNETYQIDVNVTTPVSTNYSVYYRQNQTGSMVLLGSAQTGNNSYSLSTKYQDTEINVTLFSNATETPELTQITFWTQVVSGGVTFNQNVYNTGWQTIFINSTQSITLISGMMNSTNVKWISWWNATSQKWQTFKQGWTYRQNNEATSGDAVYIKFTNNGTITRNNGSGSYNWTTKVNWNLLGLDYNGSRTLSQINTSVNSGSNCNADKIVHYNLETLAESTFTCGQSGNASIAVNQGEGFWVNATTAFDRVRSW